MDFDEKIDFIFFAVRIEKTVINILHKKNEQKSLILFEIRKETIFESH